MRSSFSGTILFVLVSTALAASSACSNQSKSNGNANAGVSAEPTPDKAAIEAQLKAREEWLASARPQLARKEITYGEFLEHCERTGAKPRPIGAFEPGGYLGPA